MKRYINNIVILLAAFLLGGSVFTSCEDIDEITNLNLDRVLSPVNLTTRVSNKTNLIMSWTLSNNADQYVIELYTGKTIEEGATPVNTYTIDSKEVPYTLTGLYGATDYTVRVKGIASDGSRDDSKWCSATFRTDDEQIFNQVANEDIEAHAVTLSWEAANATATKIILSTEGKDDITYILTSTDVANKRAYIDQLEESTTYTARLYNVEKLRGTVTFKTAIDFQGKTPVYEGDDLAAILDAAESGANIVLVSGSFVLGDYALTKSIIINGYDKADMPTVYGRIQPKAGASSIEINNIIFRADTPEADKSISNFIELQEGANISTLTVTGCEIKNYTNQILYSNVTATLGTVLFENCWADNIIGSGGDGFDLRSKTTLGTLTIRNSTFSNGIRTFLRCNMDAAIANISNCTFYKVCTVNDNNNNGLFLMDKVTTSTGRLTVEKSIFSEIGVATLGYWAKKSKLKAEDSYSMNYYHNSPNLWDATNGAYTDPSKCSATELDPQFADAANGDFTVGNAELKDIGIGDPRWLK